MATVRVFTAQRMKEIEDTTVVGGLVVGDDLILTRRNSTTINAGNVRGATGAQGPIGQPVVTGAVFMWIFPDIPLGYLPLNGQTINNANVSYPALWAASPSAWKSGNNLVLPNLKGRMPIQIDVDKPAYDTLGEFGGSESTVLSSSNLPPHYHDMSHDHPKGAVNLYDLPLVVEAADSSPGGHIGIISSVDLSASNAFEQSASNVGNNVTYDPPVFSGFTDNGPGQAEAFSNLPPFFVVQFIIKT